MGGDILFPICGVWRLDRLRVGGLWEGGRDEQQRGPCGSKNIWSTTTANRSWSRLSKGDRTG